MINNRLKKKIASMVQSLIFSLTIFTQILLLLLSMFVSIPSWFVWSPLIAIVFYSVLMIPIAIIVWFILRDEL